jgi:hypothetical protein
MIDWGVIKVRKCCFLLGRDFVPGILYISLTENEGDPLSPPEREASQGERPLTPFFSGMLTNIPGIYHGVGIPRWRGCACISPRASGKTGFFQSSFFISVAFPG